MQTNDGICRHHEPYKLKFFCFFISNLNKNLNYYSGTSISLNSGSLPIYIAVGYTNKIHNYRPPARGIKILVSTRRRENTKKFQYV
jgi:hypothetical protein